MQHYPDTDAYEVTRPHAFGQQDGAPVMTGTSDTATMDQNGARIIMQGNAHVHRKGDQERPPLDVTSSTLTLLTDQDIVETDQPAIVKHGNSVMKGNGMRYDNKTSQLQVHSAADVKISGRDRSNSVNRQPATAETFQ